LPELIIFVLLFSQCTEARTEEQTERRRKEAQGGGEIKKKVLLFPLSSMLLPILFVT